MKNIQSYFARVVLFLMLIQLSGCQKVLERIFPGHTHDDHTGCRIKYIKTLLDEEVIGTVEYDAANNPVSVTYNKEKRYELYSRLMFYDSQNRLIQYKVMYDSTDAVEDHRYGYAGDQIVSDTATITMTGRTVLVSTFEYDAKGRIVVINSKIIEFEGNPDTWEHPDPVIMHYDSNDNLVHHDYTYDEKINFRRTNKVWMFIMRNYSRNNLTGATQYNQHGLPTQFNNSQDHFFYTGALISIDYECNL